MTREAGYPIGRAPGARGGADSDVVEVRSALPPTAVHAPSLVPLGVTRSAAFGGCGGSEAASPTA